MSPAMDWKIDRIRAACAACAQAFQHDQRVLSVIDFDPSGHALRRDLCSACGPKPDSGALWWETRFQTQQSKKKKVDFDRLLRIFEAWQKKPANAENDDGALLYLITLLLVRKRFLRMVDLVSEQGREFLRLRKPGAADQSFLTPAPLLKPEDLPALRVRLEELIDGSFEEEDLPSSADAAAIANA